MQPLRSPGYSDGQWPLTNRQGKYSTPAQQDQYVVHMEEEVTRSPSSGGAPYSTVQCSTVQYLEEDDAVGVLDDGAGVAGEEVLHGDARLALHRDRVPGRGLQF